ncbi:hypothetical protein SteCoe_15387 [Stentor coeruleus]|uniref:LisH domain-containing protein n=1 Tax=Stentor coeruleus TaxID=5963 RepID=A0A1R2C3W4_9CILI|nr:hypothetical protein SteCoe_15387 [Stentor coeruleus]
MCLRLDSNDINLLIYHYLKERGLQHTAFSFIAEARVNLQELKPGSLISYLYKSLMMDELLQHLEEKQWLSQGMPECNSEFTLLSNHKCRYIQPPSPLLKEDYSVLTGHNDDITCLNFDTDIISGSLDGTIRIWPQGSSPIILPHVSAISQFSAVLSFAVSPQGRIASICEDGYLRFWNNSHELENTILQPALLDVVWNSEGTRLMGVTKNLILMWESEGFYTKEGISNVISAQWKNDCEFSVLSEDAVWLWGIESQAKNILEEPCTQARWNIDGTVLGVVSANRLGLWKADNEIWWISVRIAEFEFSPQEKVLVTGGFAGEIQFWDIERRVIMRSFQGHEGKILRISHRKDGEFVATTGSDGILHIWKSEECLKVKSINVEEIVDL